MCISYTAKDVNTERKLTRESLVSDQRRESDTQKSSTIVTHKQTDRVSKQKERECTSVYVEREKES